MILIEPSKPNLTKPEVEQVQEEKQEYKLIGSYLRTRGMRLYSYNYSTGNIEEIIIQRGNTIHIIPENGRLVARDLELEKVMVDSRHAFFEKTNYRNAEKWVQKWKEGKIQDLCNLTKAGSGINFW